MDRAVEVTHEAVGITLLFDTFSGESKNLLESFKNAGAAFHAAVIEDDGFLPDDVMSVYGFFLGDYREADSLPGKPLYFNQIQIPDYWRIEGDNSSAKVMDRTRERARIFSRSLRTGGRLRLLTGSMMPVRSGFQSIITGMARSSVTRFLIKRDRRHSGSFLT